MRISDWSSDVCSSDLWAALARRRPDVREWVVLAAALFALLYLPKVVYRADGHVYHALAAAAVLLGAVAMRLPAMLEAALPRLRQIGSASCRARVCQSV